MEDAGQPETYFIIAQTHCFSAFALTLMKPYILPCQNFRQLWAVNINSLNNTVFVFVLPATTEIKSILSKRKYIKDKTPAFIAYHCQRDTGVIGDRLPAVTPGKPNRRRTLRRRHSRLLLHIFISISLKGKRIIIRWNIVTMHRFYLPTCHFSAFTELRLFKSRSEAD